MHSIIMNALASAWSQFVGRGSAGGAGHINSRGGAPDRVPAKFSRVWVSSR